MPDSRQLCFSRVTDASDSSLEEGGRELMEEAEEELKGDNEKMNLSSTVHDGVLLAMACAHDASYSSADPSLVIFRLAMAMLLAFVSFFLQVTVLAMFFFTTVEMKEDPYEEARLVPKLELLHSSLGASPPVSLLDSNTTLARETLALCLKDTTVKGSHLVMVTIWLLRIAQEFRDCFFRLLMCLRAVPARSRSQKLVKHGDHGSMSSDHKSHEIVAMTWTLKTCCVVFVPIPQFAVAVCVSYVGVKYLAISSDMANLIWKALGLQFIVTLDDIVFNTLAPKPYKTLLKTCKVHVRGSKRLPCFSGRLTRGDREGWCHSLLWLLIIVVLAVCSYMVPWHRILSFKQTCNAYLEVFPEQNSCDTCRLPFIDGLINMTQVVLRGS
jgi:hypothetical protein